MGSLPNLNELCEEKRQRTIAEREQRDAVRERAQQLEHIRRDQLPTLFQVKQKQKNNHKHSMYDKSYKKNKKIDHYSPAPYSPIAILMLYFPEMNKLKTNCVIWLFM